jgi:hypothetical protein
VKIIGNCDITCLKLRHQRYLSSKRPAFLVYSTILTLILKMSVLVYERYEDGSKKG